PVGVVGGGRGGGGGVVADAGAVFGGSPGVDAFEVLRSVPARIDLSPGLPDLSAFPRAAWLRAERAVLGEVSAARLGYGDPRGEVELRRAVAGWLARFRGVRVGAEEVVVVAGVTQALALFAQVLGAEGVRAVGVEDPGSLGARRHLAGWGMATPPVPVDGAGVRVDALREVGVSAVVVTPAHQFPSGVVLGGGRRRELMRWAEEGGVVFEDDYDAEHRYDRAPVPAVRSMLADRVWYSGSVSKVLAPALRVGWVVVPERWREAVVGAKRLADLGNAVVPQLVVARLLESGVVERQLRVVRGRHRRRRDAVVGALREVVPGAVVHGAAAGLHVMVTWEGGGGWSDVDVAVAALERGVRVHPLSWHAQRPGPPGLVVGYGASPVSELVEGARVVGEALVSVRGRGGGRR
ncbi:aminotransferase-like domain-containing protein, partial [Nocardiopsis trehalosi]|uniref:aminotransferase-like domain-containing protein n=1 Tax=Nocardiopsis trehalosi TaxID=109329 RepID=UPI000A9461E7